MKKTFALLLCLAMVLAVFAGCGAPASTTPASTSTASTGGSEVVTTAAMAYFENFDSAKIMKSAADFLAAVEAGDDMLVVDIRQADAYAEGHIKGAINIPHGTAVAENLAILPTDVQIYVYCYTGQTASQVVALLNVAGRTASNVQKGFNNGIAKEAGYEKYIDKTAEALPTEKYDVDPAIQAAIDKYFADMAAAAGTAFASFNFKSASLKEVLDAKDDSYVVYSVRKAEDYAKGHIPTAINNPFGAGMQTKFSELPKDKKIIVQCYTGQTASQTMAILRLLGYEAYNLHGGMGDAASGSGWLGAGYEVVTD